jgi:hypothetical protein
MKFATALSAAIIVAAASAHAQTGSADAAPRSTYPTPKALLTRENLTSGSAARHKASRGSVAAAIDHTPRESDSSREKSICSNC